MIYIFNHGCQMCRFLKKEKTHVVKSCVIQKIHAGHIGLEVNDSNRQKASGVFKQKTTRQKAELLRWCG